MLDRSLIKHWKSMILLLASSVLILSSPFMIKKTNAATTILYEDFEGAFPGSKWNVGDNNPDSGFDYWDDTSYRSHSGSWSGWCAQVGDQNGVPNSDLHNYDDNMEALMYKSASLGGYSSVSLSYWYWIYSEQDWDYLQVMYFDGSFHYIDTHTGWSDGWQQSTVLIPTSAILVGFRFYSDNSFHGYEGAYVDDVVLTATQDVPNSSAHNYDDNMDAYMYAPVNLSGYSSVSLSYWYYLECEQDYDYLEVMYYSSNSWNYVDRHTGWSCGWQQSTVSIPTSATQIGFRFYGDESNNAQEGAYIDEILLSGWLPMVTFKTTPNWGGHTNGATITIDSSLTYIDSESDHYGGQHEALASVPNVPSEQDWQFSFWNYSGSPSSGVYVPDVYSNPTAFQVYGDGWLKASFKAKIIFCTDPSSVGNVEYDGTPYTDGQYKWEERLLPDHGNIQSIRAIPPTGYGFVGWSTSGNISVSNPLNNPTTLTVDGPGHLTATFQYQNPPSTPTISSTTHPDENQWYNNSNPTFQWTTPSDPSALQATVTSLIIHPQQFRIQRLTQLVTQNPMSTLQMASGTFM